ncbi:MAG: RnfABCDGE type electron transport complex subunit G [Bacillota bacterium]
MRDVLKLGFILFAICAVAAGALALVNDITEERIAAQAALRLERALASVVPGAQEFKDETDKITALRTASGGKPEFSAINRVYAGYADDGLVGVAFACAPAGYGGPIETVVGVSRDGIVTGLAVVKHAETPGLGANVANPEFQRRFVGVQAGAPVKVTKDGGQIQAITGATISSRAVASAVDQALRLFERARKGGTW